MQAGKSKDRFMIRSVSALLIGWLVFSSLIPSALAYYQEEVAQSNSTEPRVGYVDERDNTIYYIVQPEGASRSYVVERGPNGATMKWDDSYEALESTNGQAPSVKLNNPVHAQESYYYNAVDDKVHQGQNFESSPDQQWGLAKIHTNRVNPVGNTDQPYQHIKSYLLKDHSTGEVREWFESTTTHPVHWMPDSRLLLERYSSVMKQNEIVIYDVRSGQYEFVLNASLKAYHPETNQMLFTYNEPERKEWVYDFNSKQSYPITGEQELKCLLNQGELLDDVTPQLDSKLKLSQLPTKSIAVVRDVAAVARIGDQDIVMEYVIERDGTQWIPVRPLVDALGWRAETLSENAVSGYRYQFETGQNRVELNYRNSLMYQERLFMTKEHIQALGYEDVMVKINGVPGSK